LKNAVSLSEEAMPSQNGQARRRSTAPSIHALLTFQAMARPEAIAIMAPGRRPLTYRHLLGRVEATVAALRGYGLGRDDRVAVVLPNGPDMAVAFAGVAAGATCAPLNPAYRANEFEFYLTDLGAKALLVGSELDSPAREVAGRHGIPILELKPDPEGAAGVFRLPETATTPSTVSFAAPGDTALVLHTSGTTARPKIVPLTQESICSSGHSVSSSLLLTEADRCLNVMPLFHIHGLIGAFLSSLTAGASVVATPGFTTKRFFEWLDAFQPTWYTAVPAMHQAVLARAAANREILARRPLRFVRSCSAALPKRVMSELEASLGTQVIEAYGMTEASHQITSNPLVPLTRKPGSVGVATGSEVAIMDASGTLLSIGEIGEVVLRGPGLMRGYEGNPAATAAAFTNGWFRTGDQGRLDTEGYLFLTGRLKEIINRGGEKIAPREIDEVLAQHPAVSQAIAFAVPHPTLGEDLAAAVVLKEGAAVTEKDLRDYAAGRLADFKVPKRLLIVDKIPTGPTGKLQRIGLAEKLSDALTPTDREQDVEAPGTSLESELTAIWKSLLPVERVNVRQSFHALGGDSLSLASMMIEVETRFGMAIPLDSFLASPTIETLAGLLREKATSGTSLPAPRLAPPSPAARKESRSRPLRDSPVSGMKNRLLQWIALYAPGYRTTRVWLHRLRGVSIGSNVSIGLAALIETAYPSLVVIGSNVSIGMRAIIIGHLRESTAHAAAVREPTVRIEDDVYIGPGVIVLPHVTIGRGAVVSAGSVVSRSIPPGTLARGNPARPIARCGVSLGGGVSYEEFLRHLTPIKDEPAW
jgi:acyl-CoA synthetase (AMP-forming)/AMP-acid ligase II/acetyltransferase-like isoleucine patch superfamily enzyme/acyl carrier protein